MSRRQDLTGKKFGMLTVLEYSHSHGRGRIFWKCLCDCGKEHITRGSSLRTKASTSCGCLLAERRSKAYLMNTTQLPEGVAAFKQLLRRYIKGAADRKLSFDLTEVEFSKLVVRDCHYCGASPQQVAITPNSGSRKTVIGNFYYTGVDRKNSLLGYSLENCVPCCKVCNRAKSTMPYEDFLLYIKQISSFWRTA